MVKVEQQKLPSSVSTKQGDMPGFKYAEEAPNKEVDLRNYVAPQRKRKPGEPEVWNLANAFDVFRAHVAGSRKVEDVKLAGARVGGVFVAPAGVKYLVLYKRDRYRFFSRHFPNAPGNGPGIIANMKMVHWATLEGITIATIFPDGSCFTIDAMEFWKFYEEYGTELPSLPGEIATPCENWKRIF